MEKLRLYLNSLAVTDQASFARRCGTSIGYLRKAISTGARMGAELCIAIERESVRAVLCDDLLPGADWKFIRSAAPSPMAEGGVRG